ncbi:lipopolysaccharide kinase InaA family protein [Flavobacterium sp.]|uniref:lipopolysaccharide kinase InaA family protein n=1 Tax=Flavobacterium sp. TaxID=239 RepID=UPI0037BFAF65
MIKEFNNIYNSIESEIDKCILNFEQTGQNFVLGNRNTIKIFELATTTINIKSFKRPNYINKIIYRFFRKSKAQRSFEFASRLVAMQIGTPAPIAYYESYGFMGLKDSFYVSEHLENVVEFREVIQNMFFEDRENVIRKFTQFCYELHEKGIEFLDHSPGNTLIKDNNDGTYSFYLVDLNRMKFHESIDFQTRMNNLSHLTPQKEMIAIMSNEYAQLLGVNESLVFETMWKMTESFQFRYHRKKRIKKKLKFWKK